MIPEIELGEDKITLVGDGGRFEMDIKGAKMIAGWLLDFVRKYETAESQKREAARLAAIPPVDRSRRILADGSPVPEDNSHTEPRANGQQKDYVILSADERAKGFVRPVRRSYRHKCGSVTTMAQSIAETFARDPGFYSGGFCCACAAHFPNAEFVWADDGSPVGS